MARRLLAIAAALDGLSREAAARVAGMDRQALRDWVIRYNRGGPAGLSDHWGDGRPCPLTEGQQATLKAIMLQGPAAMSIAPAAQTRGRCIDPSGYDAGKKRHVLVDTQGLLMQAIIHAADIQDRDGGVMLMGLLFGLYPFC